MADNQSIQFLATAGYQLTTSVAGGQGTIAPPSGGQSGTVNLLATPATGYLDTVTWTGTDDDNITATTNTVTMDADKNVTVTFEQDPTDPSRYTTPALESLADGTLSGLEDAYTVLNNGLNDPAVNTDPALKFWHAVARTGMMIFDTNDVSINTSLLEILEPFGVTVSGNDFDTLDVNLPWDPSDPNCLLIPETANVDTAFAAINSSILPEIDAILAELDGVPNTLQISLDPSVTGLLDDLEIDGGDKLALVAALLGVKAVLSGAANPAYNILVDLSHSLFTGWECGDLPETTTLTAILAQYPDLLKILPGGAANLAQSKANLLATLNAFFAATDHILAEP